MKLLLDTCSFLWFLFRDKRIPKNVVEIIQEESNDVFVSSVSFWECAIKEKIGWLQMKDEMIPYLAAQREVHQIELLPLDEMSPRHLLKLPRIHRDPFDRILICQAIEQGLTIVTPDELIRKYPVKTVW